MWAIMSDWWPSARMYRRLITSVKTIWMDSPSSTFISSSYLTAMSEPSDLCSLVLHFHLLMETVVLSNVDNQATEVQVLDSYAAAVEGHYSCPKGMVHSTCTQILPYVPKYPTSQGMWLVVSVSQPIINQIFQEATMVGLLMSTNLPFKEMFNIKAGFCLVEVTSEHPFRKLGAYSTQQSNRNTELECTIANLEANQRSLSAMVELLQGEGMFSSLIL